jgi:D-alanine-D-alanine ligase
MVDGAAPAGYSDLAELLRAVARRMLEMSYELRLLFVTNLRTGEFTDLGPNGVMNSAQYYTQRQADEMIRSFQEIGLTVEPYFSEVDFVEALVHEEGASDPRQRVVYTTAEGGSGSGRRALIPALCNLLSVPALNSGAHASSMVRHKFHAYAVLRHAGVRIPETWQFGDGRWTGGLAPATGTRVIVKPTYESMGIGVDDDSVQIVDADFDSFVGEKTRKFGQPAVVQEFISGEEVGVPVARIGSTYALPPIAQRRANGERYDQHPKTFRDEFLKHDLSHAEFEAPRAQIDALRDAAVLAFDSLDMKGVGRIDFRVDADGRAWVIDTNGEPPPLSKTCWAVAMGLLGFSLHELLAVWVGICLFDYELISGVCPERKLAARD